MPEKSDRPKLQLHHRPVEIERKFLVANNEWRQSAVSSVSIHDGLIAIYKDRKVRVRISGDVATIAIKGPRIGIGRPEFEYEISMADAEGIFSTICQDDTLEKQRFFVQDAGATWQVDVYCGILQGVVIAEIELKQESQELVLPHWIGKEVTGDSFYKKVNMRARLKGSPRGVLVHRCRGWEQPIPRALRQSTILRRLWVRGVQSRCNDTKCADLTRRCQRSHLSRP